MDVSKGTVAVGIVMSDSLVADKNSRLAQVPQLHSQQLCPGDLIECVNGHNTDEDMREELRKVGLLHIVVQRPQRAPHATPQICSIPCESGMLKAQCPYNPVEPVLRCLHVQGGELVRYIGVTRTAVKEGTQCLQYVFAEALPSHGCIRREQNRPGSMAAMRPGDWLCASCGDHQFAKNTACQRCGDLRAGEGGEATGEARSGRERTRDVRGLPHKCYWACTNSGEQDNRNGRAVCRRCGQQRQEQPRGMPATPKRTGDDDVK